MRSSRTQVAAQRMGPESTQRLASFSSIAASFQEYNRAPRDQESMFRSRQDTGTVGPLRLVPRSCVFGIGQLCLRHE
jgi:hypothetical protein